VKSRNEFGQIIDHHRAIGGLRALAAEDPDFRRDPELRRYLRAHLRQHGRALIRQRQRGRRPGRRPGTRRVRRATSRTSGSDDGPGEPAPHWGRA
jgi:hypothetical protein